MLSVTGIKPFVQAGFLSVVAYVAFKVIQYFVWCRKLSRALRTVKGVSENPNWLLGDVRLIKEAGSLTNLRAAAFDRFPGERFLKVYLGPMPILMSREYDFFKFVTSNQTGSPTPFGKVRNAVIHVLIGFYNVIALDGPEWSLHRGTLTSLFSLKNLQNAIDFSNTLYDRLEHLWDEEIAAQSSTSQSAVIDFEPYASQLAAGTIINLLFSIDAGVLKQNIHTLPPMIEKFEAAQKETEQLMRLPPFMSNWPLPARIKLYWRCREADNEFQAIIQQRRDKFQNEYVPNQDLSQDAFDLMLNPAVQPPFSNEAIHDNILALSWAGHRPAELLISWCLYYLAKYPQHQETVFEEVAALPRPFVYDDISRCTNLDKFINEVLRITSIAPSMLKHSTTDETNYNGLQLPKGLWVMVSIFDMHRDPTYFEKPDVFDPERELASNSKFNPFSAGEKRCLGMKPARLECRAFIAAIIRGYRVELVPGANYNVIRHFLVRPEAGMKIRIHKRSS